MLLAPRLLKYYCPGALAVPCTWRAQRMQLGCRGLHPSLPYPPTSRLAPLVAPSPSACSLLGSESNVVHSYAAIAVERLLSMKEGGVHK